MALQAGWVIPGRKPVSCEMVNMMCLTGTGDIVQDMENQVKANNVRIELLEKQNEGLRNSITKLMSMQQPAPQQQPKWATYVNVGILTIEQAVIDKKKEHEVDKGVKLKIN